MSKKIDHLGIAVNSLNEALPFYEKALGLNLTNKEKVAEQKVTVAMLECGESHIELLEPTSDESPIAKFMAKKGAGIHHIAIRVENLEEELKKMKEMGIRLIDEKPRIGAGGHKIAFVHPKSTNGVLLELCE
jgi:methylmalonyl-CoA/ethylmalonyl-CoA epimerase